MKDFEHFTDEQLKEELGRRETVKKESERPVQLETLNCDKLRTLGKDYINDIEKSGYVNEDYQYWFYETALETLYGKGVWEWINKR